MKVVTKVAMKGAQPGEVVELDETEAKQLFSYGHVVPVSPNDATNDEDLTDPKLKAEANVGDGDESEDDESDEDEYPRHSGGGYYELSDGSSVRGKDDAVQAENNLERNDS